MKKTLTLIFIALIFAVSGASADMDRFIPRQGGTTEVWRITDDPASRDWANYQNTEAWSPDGRYICYEHHPATGNETVHLYDLMKDKDIVVGEGVQPRWATDRNWLFYMGDARDIGGRDTQRTDNEKPFYFGEVSGGRDVIWVDLDTGRRILIGAGITGIGETDSDDRWLFGKNRNGIVRMPIRDGGRIEDISAGGALGSFMLPNPSHPVVMFRGDSKGPDGNDIPFAPTRVWSDLEGNHVVSASPMIQRCHQAWTGDGTYHMHGNSQLRGRLWNEPFPGNLHYIAAVKVNDPCCCGRSGRWVIGSGNVWPMPVIDLRSGDGRVFLTALSFIHDSRTFSYSGGSGLHDNDAKGSPDGTKVVMSGNYNLKDAPVTYIARDVADSGADSIPVLSTDGFPESGRLSVQNEIIGYKRKTPTSFEGLTREMYDTMPLTGSMLEDLSPERRALYLTRPDHNMQLDSLTDEKARPYLNKPRYLSKGIIVTSFDHRLLPEKLRVEENIPARYRPGNRQTPDSESPLVWQRQTDVYIAVVRKPDRPYFRKTGDICELIPGENHWETRGYYLNRNGKRVTDKELRNGDIMEITEAGTYNAVAVEWSGLESAPCFPVEIEQKTTLYVRPDKPGDFQWTFDRWLVDGAETDGKTARNSEESVREIVHLVDGVIHREWYNWGQIVKHYDLNAEGKAIRRLFYHNGRLLRREFHNSDGFHVSTELFDRDGYIVESVRYQTIDGKREEIGHWWFDHGMPVKLIGCEGHTLVSLPGIYRKADNDWTWEPLPR